MSYTWGKFHGAIHSLAGEGTQRERLHSAYMDNLMRLEIRDEIPLEIKDKFITLKKTLKSDEGSIKDFVDNMEESKVKEMIDLIISMYDKVIRLEK
jgi:hypothetical protein